MIYQGAIFDLDGVLADTAVYHYQAWKMIADELGVPFDHAKNERLRGVPRNASLDIVVEDMDPKPTNMDALAKRKNDVYVQLINQVTPSELLPYAAALLRELKQAQIKIGLASSSKNARPVIRSLGIESYFDAIVDGNDVAHAKPDPEIFVTCARLLGLAPMACVVIEDAPAGIVSAAAAKTYPVALIRDESMPGAELEVRGLNEIPLSLWGIDGKLDAASVAIAP